MNYSATKINTAIGYLTLIAKGNKLTNILFPDQEITHHIKGRVFQKEQPILLKAAQQLNQYFAGERKKFDLTLNLQGTLFQQEVWNELQKIPYGETISYQELAIKIGSINNARAVGTANGKNPIPIIVPCHRVINKSGKLGGYAGGLEIKQQLLELERGK